MRKGFLAFALTIQFAFSVAAAPASAISVSVPPDYIVGAGDVLEIPVWKEDGLTKQALVRPDGGITFPLVGVLQAAGRTVHQIRSAIAERLSEFLAEPEVSVSLINLNHSIYVVGRVSKPGEFVTPHRVSVMQALSMASGLTPFADDGDVRIIRRIREKDLIRASLRKL